MPLNETEIQEIKTAVEAGTYTANPLLAPLAGLGLNFRSTADEGTYKKTVEDDVLKTREPAIHALYETEIEAQFGIKKNPGEKGTEYLKRAYTAGKEELEDLRSKRVDGDATKKDKERITELEGLLATKDDEVKKVATDYSTKLTGYKVEGQIRTATAAITAKLVKTLAGEAKDDVVEARVAKFRKEYTPVLEGEGDDEVVAWKKGDAFVNDTKGKRRSTESIMEEVFGTYVDKGQKQPGAGTGGAGGDGKKKDEPTDAASYVPGSGVANKQQLMDDMKKAGILKGTKAFTDTFKKWSEELKFTASI